MAKYISLLLLLALASCTELDPATLIKRDRILAAKVTVDGAPERAWPARGEQATVTWVTASPGATPEFSWILVACPAATSTGMPACDGDAFATSTGTGLVPTLQLTVPMDMTASAIVVAGAICASGTPVVDAKTATATCDDGSRADVVSQHIFVASDGMMNLNPQIVRAPFTADGDAWNVGVDGCDGSLPVIEPGASHVRIGVTFDATDRDTYTTPGDSAPKREDLQLAAFATGGEIVQPHSYVEADDERPQSTVVLEWDAPDDAQVVTFSFVVRDMRGGVDATTRRLCVR